MKQFFRLINGIFAIFMAFMTFVAMIKNTTSFDFVLMLFMFASTATILIMDYRNILVKGKIRD